MLLYLINNTLPRVTQLARAKRKKKRVNANSTWCRLSAAGTLRRRGSPRSRCRC